MLRKTISSAVVSAVLLSGISVFLEQNLNAAVLKKEITYQGELGKVIVNPYKVAPIKASKLFQY